ncbi:MAG: tRNA preQ1(34) S-adenosylmethionine ribosyltransferase-isomerase QueA [Pseudomonadota bacterium]
MQLSDFDFHLPEELIALRPAVPRSASRLLVSLGGEISHHQFADLPSFLRPGDRLVLNETKVIPARLKGLRQRQSDNGLTEAKVEATLLSLDQNGDWLTLAKPAKRVAVGERIKFSDQFWADVLAKETEGLCLRFNLQGADFDAALASHGMMPLPPYIASKRATDAQDNADYQPVFARVKGAVASPTASLHFTEELLSALDAVGVGLSKVLLHVGAGTFLPVKADDISNHKMHAEWGQISPETVAEIAATKDRGGRVIAVGTTSLRILEAASQSGQLQPFEGETDIFIKPGFEFRTTDGLITNFHLPKSTLLMLVSALMGLDHMRSVYAEAIDQNYRFFSYGDSSLLLPKG